ncbi:MAG: NADH-quinone oxidoreductase subunit L [Bacteroidetes bacterium]|nr:NADH-quinone oxidoreductase subunit L [Bacteroidota bacterium]
MHNLVVYVVLFPIIGVLINGLFGSLIQKKFGEKVVGVIGSAAIGLSFIFAVVIFADLLKDPSSARSHVLDVYTWIAAGNLRVSVSYLIDPLSIVMLLIVTGVSFLIHVYSIGYMHGDRGVFRFFTYLNLFVFAMLNLILADNYLLMFLGWEGVGLCSYLLIGFWYDRKFEGVNITWTGDAGMKAFIVNRIGDFAFLIGMFLIFQNFGTFNFDTIFGTAAGHFASGSSTVTWITMLLFIGATGKSAQIPLYIWLPDAMAGPTPVSALIHAATMVTAGVYMIARSSILFALAPTTMLVVAIVGAVTAMYAASMGLVQNDIKKVLAYSTISQLGYMFLAMGVGAFGAGVFHLMTHAFFKALLFLGAGAVIHALHENQDLRNMGGLKTLMPGTYKTFLMASLAISGIPPFAGFFSKDEILGRAFASSFILWLIGAITAFLTAFYIFRLFILAFEGKPRFDVHHVHVHDAPKTMLIPLWALGILSVIGGWIGIPAILGGGDTFDRFLEPVFENAQAAMPSLFVVEPSTEYILMSISVLLAVAGVYLAYRAYLKSPELSAKLKRAAGDMYDIILNKYYIDEIYQAVIVKPIVYVSDRYLWHGVDEMLIDGSVNGTGKTVRFLGRVIRKIQTGFVQNYALTFVIGIIIIIGYIILK